MAHDNTGEPTKKPLPLGFIPQNVLKSYSGKTQIIDLFHLHEKVYQFEMSENSLQSRIGKILSSKK